MTTKINQRSDAYVPPKAGSYPQLGNSGEHKQFDLAELDKSGDEFDSVTKRRKRFRFVVEDCRPVCLTALGFSPDDDVSLVIDQLFGTPGCLDRKPMDLPLTNQNCQMIVIKPGHYELREENFDLFPEGMEIKTRTIKPETAALLGDHNKAFSL